MSLGIGRLTNETEDAVQLIDTIEIVASGAGVGQLNGTQDLVSFGAAGDGKTKVAVNGNVDKRYFFDIEWVKPATDTWLTINPNGDDTIHGGAGSSSSNLRSQADGAAATTLQDDVFGFVKSGAFADRHNIEATFFAEARANWARTLISKAGRFRSPAAFQLQARGYWEDDTANLTDFEIGAHNGTSVQTGQILAGSIFRLYLVKVTI